MKVHLVDGTYELFRSYFGAPKVIHNGAEVGATRGILRSLHSLLREDGVTHVGVAFDTVIESFRNDLFLGYKTSYGVPDDLMSQFPLAERAVEALGVVAWRMIEFEADDALATFAARAAADPVVDQVVIASPDKDLRQCVRGTRVVCLDRMRRVVIDEAGVVEKFGIPPASIPDWLALVGDDADGIPGVPRWGARSAAQVLAHYGHLEAIPDDESQWSIPVRGAAALAERAVEALGAVVWRMIEFEADDALATFAARAAADPVVDQVVIASPDKDLRQCVRGTRVVCLDRMRRVVIDEAGVVEKFGIPPASIPDWLALVGDDADGIPGVPRWGARSAAQVLAHYGHIEAIPDDASKWTIPVRGAAVLAESLRNHRIEVGLYRILATLREDAPLVESLEDLQWRGARREELTALCGEIGDTELLGRIERWQQA